MTDTHLRELSETELAKMQQELLRARTALLPYFSQACKEVENRAELEKANPTKVDRNTKFVDELVPIADTFTQLSRGLVELEELRVARAAVAAPTPAPNLFQRIFRAFQ